MLIFQHLLALSIEKLLFLYNLSNHIICTFHGLEFNNFLKNSENLVISLYKL